MIIKLVRHGQSEGNANGYDNVNVPDFSIPLTQKGIQQSREAGEIIGKNYFLSALIYCSPYVRTRQTVNEMMLGAGLSSQEMVKLKVYEDVLLREVEHGYGSFEEQKKLFDTHGQFYYRFEGGESPADCYTRADAFLNNLSRQIKRKNKNNVLIISHGLTIRTFVMRFLHLKVEQFYNIKNPWNASIITLAKKELLSNPTFTNGQWGAEGVVLKEWEIAPQ